MAQVAGESPDWQSDGVLHFFHESIGTEEPINAQNAKRLARTVLPEERYSYLDPDEEDGRRGREKAPGFHNWMKSEGRWQYRLGKGWKHKKHLGTGGFGIAGLWEYEGYEGDDDNEWEKQIRHIVVKQTRMGQDLGLRQEGSK
ncbi:MAG: hypothetical protein M1818_005651 [Claussenomyces sp. TS43310]|nr:MAG: hypothetical protein M1818_005651 [Claussenomyces sp. TS43310]